MKCNEMLWNKYAHWIQCRSWASASKYLHFRNIITNILSAQVFVTFISHEEKMGLLLLMKFLPHSRRELGRKNFFNKNEGFHYGSTLWSNEIPSSTERAIVVRWPSLKQNEDTEYLWQSYLWIVTRITRREFYLQ